jgi:glutamyl-tRNA reductase
MDRLHGIFLTHEEASPSVIGAAAEPDPDRVREQLRSAGADEAFGLQTCNRVEYYFVGDADLRDHADEYISAPPGAVQYHKGLDVARHAFRVAAGLESVVVGEDEIQGQFTDAVEEAREDLGGPLETVLEKAIRVGKRVRSETAINEGHTSVATAAVELASRHVETLADAEAVVVGTGEMGRLVSRYLTDSDVAVTLTNRTNASAREWAAEIGANAVPFTDRHVLVDSTDVLVTGTAAQEPLFDRSEFAGANLVVIDLGTPGDVPPSVDALEGVDHFDLTDVEVVVDAAAEGRQNAVDEAEEIVRDELEHLKELLKRRRAEDMLSAIYRRAEEIREEEMRRALQTMDSDDAIDQEVLETATRSIVDRLLATPTESIKQAQVNGDYETLEAVASVFELEHSPSDVRTEGRTSSATEPISQSHHT